MNKSLLLKSSFLFDDSNLIDQIRQTFIDIKNCQNEEDIHDFLNESFNYLEKDLSDDELLELFSAIYSCFVNFSNKLETELGILLKKSKLNAKFIIITSYIIHYLTDNQSQLLNSECQSFINDGLNDILFYIEKISENKLTIFDHDIPPLYQNEVILSFTLSSKITKSLISKLFPYLLIQNVFSINPKFEQLFQNISNSDLINILPQNELSDQQISEFITSKNIELVPSMNESALSLVESTIIYYKNEGKNNIIGITKETILPFIAILMIFLEKSPKKVSISSKYNNLIIEGIKSLENNKSPSLNASIDLILTNQFKFSHNYYLPQKDIFEYYFILTKQLINGQYNANKILLLKNIFILTSIDNFEILGVFFNEFGFESFNFILQNIEEINKNDELKQTKLNLMFIDSTIIINLLINCKETENMIELIYFIENLCYNQPVIAKSPQISEILMKIISEKIKEENWNDVLLIGEFMKKNDFIDDLLKLIEFSFPQEIKNILFNFIPNEENDDVDNLISSILTKSNLENEGCKSLLELMLKDKEIYSNYITYLLCSYSKNFHSIENFLSYFKKEYEIDKNEFINVINKIFYYNQTEQKFIAKEGFFFSTLPISSFGESIVIKLFKLIESKPGNYEAFILLKNISSSFPFLFNNFFEKVILIVCKELKNFYRLFENFENDDHHLRTVKTSYSSLSFLVSIFNSINFFEKFFNWFLLNALNLDDSQVLGFLIALNWISSKNFLNEIHLVPIIKLNALETFGILLGRNVKKGSFSNCYKENIFNFVLKIYKTFKVLNNYVIVQIDEFLKNIENPISYIHEYIFTEQPSLFVPQYPKIKGISDIFSNFIDNINFARDFWISKTRDKIEPKPEDIAYLYERIEKYDAFTNFAELPNIPSIITIKMARYLTKKRQFIYSWIIYKRSFPFVNDQKEQLIEVINNLIDIQKNQEDDENVDVSCLIPSEFLLSQYCQQNLFKNLVKELADQSQNNELLNILISEITENEISLFSFLEFISQHFLETSEQDSMLSLLDSLISLSKKEGFQQNFVDLCGKNILNLILSPKFRSNSLLLTKSAKLFLTLNNNLPIRTTQLICFILMDKNPDLQLIFQLIKKIDHSKLNNVYHSILTIFESEIKKMELSDIFVEIVKIFPSIIEDKKEILLFLLDHNLSKFSIEKNDDKLIQDISSLFNLLAPKREDMINLKSFDDNITTIPIKIKEKSPKFWNLFEKYSNKIIELIENKPFMLDKFKFLSNYPELISFKVRSSFFRTKMKRRIHEYLRFTMKVDRKNILTTSFRSFLGKSNDQLLRRFDVVFNGEYSIDEGGPTREWFSILSKEIFNQNYGLFECSKNTKCYQPSSLSYINPNHIEYFKFAGKFIARSLIEGQCIDAHLTTPFLKQILRRELCLKDVEDIDDELYKNLDWMLNNDVDSLCMFFEIDSKELGELKTINLKENGSEINVTNENKVEFINLRTNYALKGPIEQQVKAFCDGFYSLIDYDDIKIFSPKELDLLICGIPEINVKDFIENTKIEFPYDEDSPVIKFFFEAISKWENDKLAKLLLFMTGSSRVPSNGFKEFCEMTGSPLKISSGGDKTRIPQSHTCFNTICLPKYESEDELNEKLILAIEECNTFEMS